MNKYSGKIEPKNMDYLKISEMENRTVKSRITKITDLYVEIETTETRDEWPEPFITALSIKHNGFPKEAANEFHKLVVNRPRGCRHESK